MLKWPGGWRMFALWLVGMAGWVGQASGQVHGTAGRIQDNTWSCLTPPALWWPALKPVICSSLVNKGGMVMGRNSRARPLARPTTVDARLAPGAYGTALCMGLSQ